MDAPLIGRQAGKAAPKHKAKVKPVPRSQAAQWPPPVYGPDATLVHDACVRCGTAESAVRNVFPEVAIDVEQIEPYLASVCDVCWYLIDNFARSMSCSIHAAFWDAPVAKPPKEATRRLPEALQWSVASARRIEQWRATRPADQTLRTWPDRAVQITLPSHQEHQCNPSCSSAPLLTQRCSSSPPF